MRICSERHTRSAVLLPRRCGIPFASFSRRGPQRAQLPPARVMCRNTGGRGDTFDVIPLDRVIAVDPLQIADEHRIVETEPRTEGAERGGFLGNEKAQLYT